ncbi:MBL fold metallo-hydrolase [Flagellimonas sp.]|uniref:MBL fold metallo-hydrolase n=1 Tax=Flagellimonas sp. TaxID=2058762 RepID=UPI003B5C9309
MKVNVNMLLSSLVFWGCGQSEKKEHYSAVDAHIKGVELIKTAANKHGDFYSDSKSIAFEVVCDKYYHPTQSQVPFHPMVPGFWNRLVWVSPNTEEEILNSKMKAGSYVFHDVAVLQNKERISYNVNTKTYEENSFEFVKNLDIVPQTYLQKTLENQASIRATGVSGQGNLPTFMVEAFFDNAQHKIWLNKDTTLVKVENLRHSSTYGLRIRSYTFKENREINGYLLPSEISYSYTNNVSGNVVSTFRLNPVKEETVTEFLEEISSYSAGDHSYRKKAEVTKLADKIHLIENVTSSSLFWSYNILFAEFNDYVLVTEAPVSEDISKLVIDKIRETIPNKPIRFIVQSHHHSDHIAGIRQYIDNEITIVTTPATSKVIEKINKSYQYTDRDHPEPRFQIVDHHLNLSDDSLTARVIDLGPTLHSDEMVITYFPREKIIFQADLVNYGEWPINNDISVEFAEKIKELKIPVNMIVGLHGQSMNKDEVEQFLNGTLKNKFGNQ